MVIHDDDIGVSKKVFLKPFPTDRRLAMSSQRIYTAN